MSNYIRYEGSKGRSTYVNQDDGSKVLDNLKSKDDFIALKKDFDNGIHTFEEYEGSAKQSQDLADQSAVQYKEDRAVEFMKKSTEEQLEMLIDATLYPGTAKGDALGIWYNGIKDSNQPS